MNFHTENTFLNYEKPYSNIINLQIFNYEKPYFKTGEIRKQRLVFSGEEQFKTLLNLGVWKSIPFYKYQYEIDNCPIKTTQTRAEINGV